MDQDKPILKAEPSEKELISESIDLSSAIQDMSLTYSDEEANILLFVQERYKRMSDKKKDLGIDYKCALYDRLYTPHRVLKLKNYDKEFEKARLATDEDDGRKANKSKPIAFEKVQTALATIIKENPKAFMKPYGNRWKKLNDIVKAAYEHNWDENRTLIELRKFVFQMAKYGIAYGRRYIKKEYKIIHNQDGKKERVVKFYDAVWETIHPRNILLDEQCTNPRDARDLFIVSHLTLNQLRDIYPDNDRIDRVPKGRWLTAADHGQLQLGDKTSTQLQDTYEHLVYENEYKDIKLIVVNGVLISGPDEELPGHQLSIFGEKWAEKDESYDGIGLCEVLENYQPLVDDVANADIDLVREVIRPKLYMGSGLVITDESAAEDVDGQRIVKFEGDINQLKYDRPTRTGDATQLLQQLNQEIDDATGIARDLSSISEAATLGQASFNRENSLRRLSLPLDSIKNAIEDDAQKALPLFRIVNSEPIDTYEITDEAEMLEANAIMRQFPDDERFVKMEDGKIVRRLFKEAELPIERDTETGAFYQSDAKTFWEMIPSTFDWQGKINIVPMSFLGESQAMQQDAALQDMNILMGIQDLDPMGMPTLVDEQGRAYKIDRLQIIKDYLKARSKDPDEYLLDLTPMNVAGMNQPAPMTNPANLQPTQSDKMGMIPKGPKQ